MTFIISLLISSTIGKDRLTCVVAIESPRLCGGCFLFRRLVEVSIYLSAKRIHTRGEPLVYLRCLVLSSASYVVRFVPTLVYGCCCCGFVPARASVRAWMCVWVCVNQPTMEGLVMVFLSESVERVRTYNIEFSHRRPTP